MISHCLQIYFLFTLTLCFTIVSPIRLCWTFKLIKLLLLRSYQRFILKYNSCSARIFCVYIPTSFFSFMFVATTCPQNASLATQRTLLPPNVPGLPHKSMYLTFHSSYLHSSLHHRPRLLITGAPYRLLPFLLQINLQPIILYLFTCLLRHLPPSHTCQPV